MSNPPGDDSLLSPPEVTEGDGVSRRDAVKTLGGLGLAGLAGGLGAGAVPTAAEERPSLRCMAEERRNVVFMLSDDHRYDFFGFMDESGTPEWLETPNFDRMAAEGGHLENAFVTTSLCSPSRASVLTGQYAHQHGVIDNQHRVPDDTVFFPEYLQDIGYETAFIGKWHMGRSSAEPRKGFDHWVSFRGQGQYFDPTFNVNGETVEREGYMTDLITEYALDWLKNRENPDKPFFLYVSHKAVHHGFRPAPRHEGEYSDVTIDYPETMADTEENYAEKPEWLEEQRDSMHGVDWLFHGNMEFDDLYRRYSETLLALDEGVGAILDYLDTSGLSEETLAMYMGDNGFYLGEHGIIDKRSAYEESIRVPLLAWAPGMIEPDTTVSELVANIDIGPTSLNAAGRAAPDYMAGRSFLPLLKGEDIRWRNHVFYEYFWEEAFPQQPTTFSVRSERYKYIWYYGIWATNEFYDLMDDLQEQNNLIDSKEHQERIGQMEDRLFDLLAATEGMKIPLRRPPGWEGGSARRPEDAPTTAPKLGP